MIEVFAIGLFVAAAVWILIRPAHHDPAIRRYLSK